MIFFTWDRLTKRNKARKNHKTSRVLRSVRYVSVMSKNEKQAGLPAKNKSRSAHFSNLYCRTDMASEIAQEAMREYGAEHAGAPDGV